MSRRPGEKPRTLPESWHPDVLDPLEREEYDHLAGYGMTADEIVRRLGWSIETIGRRAHRRNTERSTPE